MSTNRRWIVIACLALSVALWGVLNWQKGNLGRRVTCAEYNWAFYTDVPVNSVGYPFVFAESKLDEEACNKLMNRNAKAIERADSQDAVIVFPEEIGVAYYEPYQVRLKGLLADLVIWLVSTVLIIKAAMIITENIKRKKK